MDKNIFRILSLDGGGAKGIYSLGVLAEIEKKLGTPIVEHFDGFYGCSTGSIIAAGMAAGRTVDHAVRMYLECIPRIMSCYRAASRTRLLREALEKEFGNMPLDQLKKDTAIVTTSVEKDLPLIFKSHNYEKYKERLVVEPGTGHTVVEAVMASCSAPPFFTRAHIRRYGQDKETFVVDGTYAFDNPILIAMVDAQREYNKKKEEIAAVSVGTGDFPLGVNPQLFFSIVFKMDKIMMANRLMDLNVNTMELIRRAIFGDYRILRINDTYAERSLRTSLLENNIKKLKMLYEKGRESFRRIEKDFDRLFLK